MTTKSYDKAFKQLDSKPAIKNKFIKHNSPKKRSCGIALKPCKRCGRKGAHVGQYNLNLCRQCFRDIAKAIGFKKYSWG